MCQTIVGLVVYTTIKIQCTVKSVGYYIMLKKING